MNTKRTVLTVAAVGTGGAIVYMLYKLLVDGKSISDTVGESVDQVRGLVSNPADGERLYGPIAQQAAAEVGIPYGALAAIAYNETKWGAYKHSSSECNVNCASKYEPKPNDCSIGLTQVLTGTAVTLGVDPANLCDPYWGLKAGALYLKKLNDRFNGDWEKTFRGYNAGPGNVTNPPQKTKDYATRALAIMDSYQGQAVAGLGGRLLLLRLRA